MVLRPVLLALIATLLLAGCDSAEERAREHYEAGLALKEEGAWAKAALEFRNALRLDDTLAPARLELGIVTQQTGDFAAAINHYAAAMALDETLLEPHLRLGEFMLAAGRLEEAKERSDAAFELAPKNPRVLVLRATLQYELGNAAEAARIAEEALGLDPDASEARVVLAALARDRGATEEALAILDAGLATDPGNLGMGLMRIDVLSNAGRGDEVGDTLRAMVEASPEDVALRQQLVRFAIARGDLETAETELRALAALQPGETEPALDVVRFLIQAEGLEAGRAELEARIAAAETPGAALPFHLALADIDIAEDGEAAAIARLEGVIDALGDDPAVTEARIALARLQIRAGDMAAARALVAAALEEDETNAEALALEGRFAIEDERYDDAITLLRAALDADPDDATSLQLLALAHQRNGNPDLARERLAAAVEASGNAAGPSLALARFLARRDEAEQAEAVIERALETAPENRDLLAALANLRLSQADWAGADEIAGRLAEIDAGNPLGRRVRAASLYGQGRFNESIELLKEETALPDAERPGLSALIASYVQAGRMEDAKTFLTTLLTENPDNAEAHGMMARIHAIEGDLEAAEESFLRAVEIAPADSSHVSALAQFYQAQGRSEEGIAALRAGLAEGENQGLRLGLALQLEATGDLEGAIAEYAALYEMRPDSEVVANNYASLLTDTDPTAEEIERAYRIAKRLRDSRVPHFLDTYGWILHLRGDHEEALRAIEQAVASLPQNPIVQYHYGAVLAALGQDEVARGALERAIQLAGDRSIPQIEDAGALLATLEARAGAGAAGGAETGADGAGGADGQGAAQ